MLGSTVDNLFSGHHHLTHSAKLTYMAVRGNNQPPPGIVRNKISTQQSTWTEMMESSSSNAFTRKGEIGESAIEATNM
jgi:hypothetical protein